MRIERVGRRGEDFRRLLEKRVAVVPWAQVAGIDVEALGKMAVQVGLHRMKRPTRRSIYLLERLDEPVGLELIKQELGVPVVWKSDCVRGLVAQVGDLAQIVRYDGTDLFARLPGLASSGAVRRG